MNIHTYSHTYTEIRVSELIATPRETERSLPPPAVQLQSAVKHRVVWLFLFPHEGMVSLVWQRNLPSPQNLFEWDEISCSDQVNTLRFLAGLETESNAPVLVLIFRPRHTFSILWRMYAELSSLDRCFKCFLASTSLMAWRFWRAVIWKYTMSAGRFHALHLRPTYPAFYHLVWLTWKKNLGSCSSSRFTQELSSHPPPQHNFLSS